MMSAHMTARNLSSCLEYTHPTIYQMEEHYQMFKFSNLISNDELPGDDLDRCMGKMNADLILEREQVIELLESNGIDIRAPKDG